MADYHVGFEALSEYCHCEYEATARAQFLAHCPHCHKPVDTVRITEEARAASVNSNRPKRNLFCVALLVKKGGAWHGLKEYLHANDIQDARLQYMRVTPPKDLLKFPREVVGISQVIGYFVEDEKGHVLSVD